MKLAAAAILVCHIAAAAPAPHTVSTSRQFIVFGGDTRLRGSVAQAAERQKSELLTCLQIPDRWSVPILVNLGQPQANVPELPPVALNFSQTGAGLKIQLDLLIDREWDPAILQREVLRALLLEMSYRPLPSLPAGEVYNLPPDWLVDGILNFNNTSAEFSDALQSAAMRPPALKNFLALHPVLLDSQSRALYRASAVALLRTLVAPGDGRARLVRYIADWSHASADVMGELQAHFPALGKDEQTIEANWSASFARIAEEQHFALFSFAETSQQLDQCLQQTVARDTGGKAPLTLARAIATPHSSIDKPAIRGLAQRLMLLAAHAHPLLRSVVVDYQIAAESLGRGQTRGLAKRLTTTAALRERISARMREVEDYMNWFEATQVRKPSGAFRDYVRAVEAKDAATRRRDPLSVYLDALETQLQ
ncbi:MAG: hypothetical protein ACR2FX_01225 [Chthoniobacterales bacterium]